MREAPVRLGRVCPRNVGFPCLRRKPLSDIFVATRGFSRRVDKDSRQRVKSRLLGQALGSNRIEIPSPSDPGA